MLADGFLTDTDNLINTKAVRNYPAAITSTKEKYPVGRDIFLWWS